MAYNLNHRITLLNPTNVKSATGGNTPTYAAIGEYWADYVLQDGGTITTGGQGKLTERAKFRLRYWGGLNDSITKDTRISFKGKQYSIEKMRRIGEKLFYIELEAVTEKTGL